MTFCKKKQKKNNKKEDHQREIVFPSSLAFETIMTMRHVQPIRKNKNFRCKKLNKISN